MPNLRFFVFSASVAGGGEPAGCCRVSGDEALDDAGWVPPDVRATATGAELAPTVVATPGLPAGGGTLPTVV